MLEASSILSKAEIKFNMSSLITDTSFVLGRIEPPHHISCTTFLDIGVLDTIDSNRQSQVKKGERKVLQKIWKSTAGTHLWGKTY